MRNCERQVATPKIILFVFKGMWVCRRQTRRDDAVRACPPAVVFLTRHLPTGKVFFLQKNVKNGKKGAIY